MKRVIIVITAAALAGVCSADEQKIKLTFCTDKAIADIIGSHHWVNCGQNIKVCGKEFRIDTKVKDGVFSLGIDMNDDGKMTKKETASFPVKKFEPFMATFCVKVAGEERDVPVYIDGGWTKGDQAHLSYRSAWAMSAKINGQTVYFINNPHDGKFGVGNTFYATKSLPYGMPLRPNICVNGKFYQASIAEDGTELTLNEINQDKDFGKLSMGKSSTKNCKCLILLDEQWAFDLVDPKIANVPAGTFEIMICMYEMKGATLKSGHLEGGENAKMTFKADKDNIVNVGSPFTYYVKATIDGNTVQVDPVNSVMGNGGEMYWYSGPKCKISPLVTIYKGKISVSKGKMPFGNDDELFRYVRTVKGLSESTGSVEVKRMFPGIGALKGTVKFSEGQYPEMASDGTVTYKLLKTADDTEKGKK